ncbi:MAG: sugar kinase, ribokinase family [halophilic archaeon J07HX5]|jgi:Sugar kinases, ribokinase family|nr:MAG: sugar kinase, ribokinase family [halophilic archaeon J07HX5]
MAIVNSPDHVLVVGDTTADLHPAAALSPGSELQWFPGGTATNVARGLALFDTPPALATRVGTDPFGRAVRTRLTSLGIDTTRCVTDPRPTPLTMPDPTDDRPGDTWTAWVRDTCYGVTLPDPVDAVETADLVHCSGTVLPPAVNQATVTETIAATQSQNVALSFDLNGRHNQWESAASYRDALTAPLAASSVVFASEHDLTVAGREPTLAGLKTLFPDPPSALVVLTQGADGATAARFTDGAITTQASHPGFSVDVAGTAGAGDAVTAAVLALLQAGVTALGQLLAVGTAAGAATTASAGPVRPADRNRMARLLAEWPTAWAGDGPSV